MSKELDFSSYKECVIRVHNTEQARDVAMSASPFCSFSGYSAEYIIERVSEVLSRKGNYSSYCMHFMVGEQMLISDSDYYISKGFDVIDFDDFPAVEEPIYANDIGGLI